MIYVAHQQSALVELPPQDLEVMAKAIFNSSASFSCGRALLLRRSAVSGFEVRFRDF
jgi:hypothetical protein